jgi:hypothetical protein
MATRSTIAMEQPDGRVMQIYCHWDGYLGHNGEILQQHYRNRAKVLALMLLGSISSLREQIGEPHDFDARYTDGDVREDWCVAYGRDRGEKGVEARVFQDFDDYRNNHQYEEFEYIFRTDDQWYVAEYQREYRTLEQALLEVQSSEDA